MANVARALPDIGATARARIVRESFEHAGIGTVEALCALCGLSPSLRRFSFEGAEHVDAALARGRGVILVQPRFGCLDAAARAVDACWPVTVVSGVVEGTAAAGVVRRRRARLVTGIVGNDDLPGMLDVLRRGEVLWLSPDVRVPKARCGFPSRYFGQVAMSSGAPALLSRMTGAALVPYLPLRDGAGYRLRFDAALCSGGGVAATTQRINDAFEAQVRDAPEQYLWMNRRFEPGPRWVSPPKRSASGPRPDRACKR